MARYLFIVVAVLISSVANNLRADSYISGVEAAERGQAAEAIELLTPMAESGDARAQYSLGKVYERGGQGVASNVRLAALWYQRAAEQGIAAAQNNLALMYAQGRGVDSDSSRAIELWLAAAKNGHAMAQYNLGVAYFRGEGVERDQAEGAVWFNRAADAGVAPAQFLMGQMHRLGLMLPRDKERALGWYQLAEAQGHVEAKTQASKLMAEGITPLLPFGKSLDADTTKTAVQTTMAADAAPEPASKKLEAPRQEAIVTQAAKESTAMVKPEPAPLAAPTPIVKKITDVEDTAAKAPVQLAETKPITKAAPAEVSIEQPAKAAPVSRGLKAAPKAEKATSRKTDETAVRASVLPAPAAPNSAEESLWKSASAVPPAEAKPVIKLAPAKPASQPQVAAVSSTEPAAGGEPLYRVWLASIESKEEGRELWAELKRRHADVLPGAQVAMPRIDLGKDGVLYRILAGPLPSRQVAVALCGRLKSRDPDAFCKVMSAQ